MTPGKQFENDFKASVPFSSFIYRFKDSSGAWGGPNINTDVLNKDLIAEFIARNPELDIGDYDFPEYSESKLQKIGVMPKQLTRFTPQNICDFMLFDNPTLYFLELKSTKSKSLSHSSVRNNQIKELSAASMIKGINAGFVVNFRELEETYFMSIETYNECVELLPAKSIPVKVFRDHATLICQEKKQVHYRYDIERFLINYIEVEAKLF